MAFHVFRFVLGFLGFSWIFFSLFFLLNFRDFLSFNWKYFIPGPVCIKDFRDLVYLCFAWFSLYRPLGRFSLVVVTSVYKFIIMCNNVPSVNNQNWESWRILVEECIANIRQLRTPLFWAILWLLFNCFFCFFLVFLNQPTVHSGEVSRLRVRGCWR